MRKEQHAIYSSGKLELPQGPNTSKLWDAEEESCSLQERQAHFEPVKWLQWDPRKKTHCRARMAVGKSVAISRSSERGRGHVDTASTGRGEEAGLAHSSAWTLAGGAGHQPAFESRVVSQS